MRKYLFLTLLISCIFVSQAGAHSPASVDLSYDQEGQVLKVKIKHITQAIRKHYIRKIEVRKNDEEHDVYLFHWQKDNSLIEEEFKIKAEVGDVLNVKVTCKKGGSKMASLTVEALVDKDEEKVEGLDGTAEDEPKGSQGADGVSE